MPVRWHNSPGADARRARAYNRASREDKFGKMVATVQEVRQESGYGKKSKFEMPATRRRRYEREIKEREKEIRELEGNIRFWQEDQAESKAKNAARNAEDNARVAEIRADTENGWTDEQKERRINQVKHDYREYAERMRVQVQIMQHRIDEAIPQIADLKRKIADHQRYLDVHSKGKVERRATA